MKVRSWRELAEEERKGGLKGPAALKETGHWAEPVAMKEGPAVTGGFENRHHQCHDLLLYGT